MSGTATVQPEATLRPSKAELLSTWLPTQPWFRGNAGEVTIVGKFRFQDPAGEVGLDSMFVRSGQDLYYVPVTWRSESLPAWARLIGQLHHSTLGKRYCYDAATDPVFRKELHRVIVEGDTGADVMTIDGRRIEQAVQVVGNGVDSGTELRIIRRLGTYYPGAAKLTATWQLGGVQREDVIATIS